MDAAPAPILHVEIRAVSHPAMRQTAACIARILAAGGNSVACTLETSSHHEPGADSVAIYLRPAATDALALTVMAEAGGDPRLRAAFASMAAFDERCRTLFCLSWENLLANPHGTLRALANHLHVPLPESVWSVVDEEIGMLRREVDRYDHPLPFIAALDGAPHEATWTDKGLYAGNSDAGVAHLLRGAAPRSLLVVTRSGTTTAPIPLVDTSDWQVSYLTVENEAALAAAAGAPAGLGIIYFHDIEAMPAVGALLDCLMPRLADGGLLCGEEVSDPAVASATAKLTANGDRHGLTFTLSGRRWSAAPPAWYL